MLDYQKSSKVLIHRITAERRQNYSQFASEKRKRHFFPVAWLNALQTKKAWFIKEGMQGFSVSKFLSSVVFNTASPNSIASTNTNHWIKLWMEHTPVGPYNMSGHQLPISTQWTLYTTCIHTKLNYPLESFLPYKKPPLPTFCARSMRNKGATV